MTTRVTFSWENFDNVILAWLPFPQVFQVKIIDNLIGFNLCKRLTLNNHSEIKECNTAATINTTHQGTLFTYNLSFSLFVCPPGPRAWRWRWWSRPCWWLCTCRLPGPPGGRCGDSSPGHWQSGPHQEDGLCPGDSSGCLELDHPRPETDKLEILYSCNALMML